LFLFSLYVMAVFETPEELRVKPVPVPIRVEDERR
jgi:hypothetical protein